jgi:8-oxo-dGTP diphosphatase
MLQVVAAIIERPAGVLICRRRPDQSHPLQWEFPGGKVELGETPAAGLARELEEELGISGATGDVVGRYEFAYPGKPPVDLIFYRVLEYSGEPLNLIFEEMRWAPRATLGEFDFVEGDREFLASFISAP